MRAFSMSGYRKLLGMLPRCEGFLPAAPFLGHPFRRNPLFPGTVPTVPYHPLGIVRRRKRYYRRTPGKRSRQGKEIAAGTLWELWGIRMLCGTSGRTPAGEIQEGINRAAGLHQTTIPSDKPDSRDTKSDLCSDPQMAELRNGPFLRVDFLYFIGLG